MKYFTQNRASFDALLECARTERIKVLLQNGDQCHVMTSLFDFLASCAEGKNKLIESLCQSVLGVGDLLDVIAHADVTIASKHAFVR